MHLIKRDEYKHVKFTVYNNSILLSIVFEFENMPLKITFITYLPA